MPQQVRTPRQVFDALGSGVFVVIFRDGLRMARLKLPPTGWDDLQAWFEQALPGRTWEKLAPPEETGITTGGIGNVYAVYPMSQDDMARYSERWEIGTDGKSADPRWHAVIYQPAT